MRKAILAVMVVMLIALIPTFSISDTLAPPWKRIVKTRSFEYWYDTSKITKTPQYIDVDVWEVSEDSSTFKHIKFERATGLRGYGQTRGTKSGKEVYSTDVSKMTSGYMFSKIKYPEEKKLFRLLNK